MKKKKITTKNANFFNPKKNYTKSRARDIHALSLILNACNFIRFNSWINPSPLAFSCVHRETPFQRLPKDDKPNKTIRYKCNLMIWSTFYHVHFCLIPDVLVSVPLALACTWTVVSRFICAILNIVFLFLFASVLFAL